MHLPINHQSPMQTHGSIFSCFSNCASQILLVYAILFLSFTFVSLVILKSLKIEIMPALYFYNKDLQDLKEKKRILCQENEALKQENKALHKEIANLKKSE